MSRLTRREGIKVEGYRGTWYVIDEAEYDGKTLYLLEHETYGDETAGLIVDDDANLMLDNVWNGFLDYDEYLEYKAYCEEVGEDA